MKPVVRFKGLVSLAEGVRREIGKGLGKAANREVRAKVVDAISTVDRILRQRGVTASHLATPSKRAYQFLSQINWDSIAERDETTSVAASEIRWKGLGPFAERMMSRLAAGPSDAEVAEIARAIASMSGRIERSVQQAVTQPVQLTPPTRAWRGWFAWLAIDENLRACVRALGLARKVMETEAMRAGRPTDIRIQFQPMRQIYRMRSRRGGATIISLPTPMVSFDESGFAVLAKLVFARDLDVKRRVIERMRTQTYVAIANELEALGGVVDQTHGAFHDLGAAFERVNAKYFGGTLSRPVLTWSRSLTRRKFGHYDHLRDAVMVSSTLDHDDVPEFVVDYLMFHELLHKKHGIRWVNGRGHAHTREFYADERAFERFEEADAWLMKLARKR